VSTVGSSLFIADLSTAVGRQVPVEFRIQMLATVAVVFGKWFVVLEITLRTFPVEDVLCLLGELLVDVADPFFDAFEMH
jgi:hypothetical protein